MYPPPILIFCIVIFLIWVLFQIFGGKYALDIPGPRKSHQTAIPQIGGLIFGSFFLFIIWWFAIVPSWFIIGGALSILIGAVDDYYHVPWKIKLFFQIILVVFLSNHFWGRFDEIVFYSYAIHLSEPILFVVFLIWFVGIYNAVNLLDGLDSLAGGFMFILCIGLTAINTSSNFFQLNYVLSIILLGYLVYNQRPAKIFMGDAGSLLLGFYVSTLPLLFMDLVEPNSTILNMEPFIILVSFLIADTSRVFFTRLLSGKNPMTADTIHLHHLIMQKSGSYLATIAMVLSIGLISTIFSIISFQNHFNINGMLLHLTLIFFFILTPPAPTYVNLITKIINPIYNWNKKFRENYYTSRTLLIFIMLILLTISIISNIDYKLSYDWQYLLSLFIVVFFVFLNRKKTIVIPVLQICASIIIFEFYWSIELNILAKLCILLILISIGIFTIQRVPGTALNTYSALDLIIILLCIGGIILYLVNILINPWLLLAILSMWFGLGFVLRRTIYTSLIEK